ncbi:hypothetical protein, partial [Alcaligenes sp. PF14]|uniref:hypothetical protein n=1 Tax=Alcaligenes sp. PF14 TaxID=3120297 RepID=UPI003018AAE6
DDDELATVNIVANQTDITEGEAGTFTVSRAGGDQDQVAKVKLGLNLGGKADADDFVGTLQVQDADGNWIDVDPNAEYEVPANGGLQLRVVTADDKVYEGPEDFTVEITEVINALEG